jgi:hypothetical protein
MRNRYLLIALVLLILGFGAGRLSAGSNLDSPAGPTDPTAQMVTLDQIYDHLNAGTAATKMTTFTEPSSGPGSTMHTLNDIIGMAPAEDNTSGAVPAEVLAGKKYWSLRTDGSGGSSWGLEAGTAPAGSDVNGYDGSKTFTIPDGLYSGKTATANDSNLLAGNIKKGVTIFGVTGTCQRVEGCYPAPRWCDNGDGTVTDLDTGRMWTKNANLASAMKKWNDAWDYAYNLDYAGYDDWGLPSKAEFDKFVNGTPNLRCSGPGSCDLYAFTNIQSNGYWSGLEYDPDHGFAVQMKDGTLSYYPKDDSFYVWPVRVAWWP